MRTHSSMVTPSMGMNGTTSAAPMRGCTPEWSIEVDQLDGLPDGAQGRFAHRFGSAGKGQHGAVVVGVQLAVEDDDARHGAHGLDQGVHLRGVPAFGKIRHALDQSSGHSTSPSR